jgi:hypothetical protein
MSRPSPANTTVQKDMAVEKGAGQEARLGKNFSKHLLGLVDDQQGPADLGRARDRARKKSA